MAKEGTKVDELFLSLGLDLSQFDIDMATASKTVGQAVKDLSGENTRVKLRMDIDSAKLEAVGNATGALDARIGHLNTQFANQKRIVDLLNASYQKHVQEKGDDNATTQRSLTGLLRQQKVLADLSKQINEVTRARQNMNRTEETGNVANTSGAVASLASVEAAAGRASAAIMAARSSIAGLFAFSIAGGGLIDAAKSAIAAGDAIYILSTKMHMTATEASLMNRMLKMSDVDAQSFVATMLRLDKSVLNAPSGGNDMTNTLKTFGVSLTDTTGRLLPYNQQLAQLAKGYQNAAKSGQEEEFVAQTLGARGAALVPMLQDFAEKLEDAKKVSSTGLIDPKQAHEAQRELNVLSAQAGQLKIAFGAALIPVATDLAPQVTEELKKIVSEIKNNRQEITDFAKDMVDVTKGVADIAKVLGSAFSGAVSVFKAVNDGTGGMLGGVVKIGAEFLILNKLFSVLGNVAKPLVSIFTETGVAAKVTGVATRTLGKGFVEATGSALLKAPGWIKIAGLVLLAANAIWDFVAAKNAATNTKDPEQDRKNFANLKGDNPTPDLDQLRSDMAQQADIKRQADKTQVDAEKSLQNDIYKLTHTEHENELHDLDEKVKDYQAKGVDMQKITEWSAAARAKIEEKYNQEILKKREELEDKIYKLTHTAHESALQDVNREVANMKKPNSGYDPTLVDQLAAAERKKIAEDEATQTQELTDKIYKLKHDSVENSILDIQREADAMRKSHADDLEYVRYATQWEAAAKSKVIQDLIKQENSLKEQRSIALKQQEQETRQTYDRIRSYVSGEYGDVVSAVKNALAGGATDNTIQEVMKTALQKQQADKDAMKKAIDLVRTSVDVPSEVVNGNLDESNKKISELTKKIQELESQRVNIPVDFSVATDSENPVNIRSGVISQMKTAMTELANTGNIGATAAANFFAPWKAQIAELSSQLANLAGNTLSQKGVTNAMTAGARVINNLSLTIPVTAQVNSEADIGALGERVSGVIVRRLEPILGGSKYGY